MEEPDNPSESPDLGSGSTKRACDQCRHRKIRCDKETPTCSNCRIANRQCSSTGLGFKPKEPRQRVLITHQYERKIDGLDARLGAIERMLHSLTLSINNSNNSCNASTSPSQGITETLAAAFSFAPVAPPPIVGSSPDTGDGADALYGPDDGNDDDSVFEGHSSLRSQTVFAGEFLESAVAQTPFQSLDPQMQSALSSLQQIVGMQNRESSRESRLSHAKPLPKGGIRDLPMPPSQVVVGVLRELKEFPPASLTTILSLTAVENFGERCRKVYFAIEDYSIMFFGTVNATLYFLFRERAAFAEGTKQTQLLECMAVCRDNFETVLANLPLLMPTRRESIEVLLIGSMYSIETGKYSLARDLNTSAAMMCQNLGYHKLKTPSTPEHEEKALVFWLSYLLDKALSLRAGRASVIQDYDVTVPMKLGDSVNVPNMMWRLIMDQWIVHAHFMGKAYDKLYSPVALTLSPEQRAENARELIQVVENLADKADPIIKHTRQKVQQAGSDANTLYSMDLAILGDDLIFWSALTLIHRAIPPPPGSGSNFSPDCIQAARKAFEAHEKCMEMAGDHLYAKAGYLNWNVIYIPFIPIIVLFCHIVETSDRDDLKRLSDFVDGLLPVCPVSEAIDKLYRISQVLLNVANLCIKTRSQGATNQNMSMVGNDVDMYLNQLGFMPQYHAHPGSTAAGYGNSGGNASADLNADQAAQLGNWFSGNTHILGLLDEDLSGFDPNTGFGGTL
ncbi:hypothetical protein QBC35DRAFT_502472 [Podospora australis]|uniref:Zn(2)-C6 fungal-type domain-containing protein n=1 Tax=Podospora australis TaxID=1536484 RepID=A0AAN6WPY1_9PEZI|nr:hypothetical protein QBC35DRAFT_502472 [Podospora australis]